MTKIILADDHILLRDALTNLINSFSNFNVVGVAGDGTAVLEMIEQQLNPDIVILDLNMPKLDGYETAKWIQKNHPKIKILILTMFDSEVALIRLLQSGVRGFLKKDIHPSELRNALESVTNDGYYYSHTTTGKLGSLFNSINGNISSLEKALLSNQEIEFLKLASTDMTYKEIAGVMHLTPRIIDSYRDTLFDKLNVKSRVGLAIYAVKHGVIHF